MSTRDERAIAQPNTIVNDFSIQVATVNGSGSQSSNFVLMRSIFKMGIPVSEKNIFPINIQGLPTWYNLRLKKNGYLVRLEKDNIVVAMDSTAIERDLEFLVPHGVLFINMTSISSIYDRI